MLDRAIDLLATTLNTQLKLQFAVSDDLVVVSNLLDLDGSVVSGAQDRLVLFLVNVEPDAGARSQPLRYLSGAPARDTRPGQWNLSVMLSASFSGARYAEGLQYLSAAVELLRANPVLARSNAPDMDVRIERLTVEVERLSLNDLSNLWRMLGGRYMPSILYGVRVLVVEGQDGDAPTVHSTPGAAPDGP